MARDKPIGRGKGKEIATADTLASDTQTDATAASIASAIEAGMLPTNKPNPRAAATPDGDTLGRFSILGKLGEGGMGTVLAAYDPTLDRKIAVKLLRRGTFTGEAAVRAQQRLVREARAMARLNHPNVVAVHEVGQIDDGVFIAMEYVDGCTLRDWLSKPGRSWREIVATVSDAGRGLAAAHAHDLIHRDFKPENILVGKDDRVRVVDFGLAGVLTELALASTADESSEIGSDSAASSSHLTRTGALLGTPYYMAPEQHRGDCADARSDQFAFAVVLYEALYHRRPFAGASYDELSANVREQKPRSPPADSDVPSWLAAVVMRGLAREPSERYADMDKLLAALARDPAARRRHRRRVAGVALALTLALAAAIVAWSARSESSPPCQRPGKLHAVWNDERGRTVATTFAASGRPYAEVVYQRVAHHLDAYAADWAAAWTDACAATHVRAEQDDVILDLRMRCLDRSLARAAALIELFTEAADVEVLDNAIAAAANLGDLASCADSAALTRALPPPAANISAMVDDLSVRLARAEALAAAGKYAAALDIAREVATAAATIDYPPLLARALFARGSLEYGAGDARRAERTLRASLPVAARARDDTLSADIRIELVWVVGVVRARHDEVDELATFAKVAVDRTGSDSLRARLANRLAGVDYSTGEYVRAAEHYERELAFEMATLPPDHPRIANTLNRLGAALNAQGKHVEAKERYDQAFAIFERAFGPDHPSVAGVLANRGLALLQQGKYDQARGYYDRALAIRERVLGPEHPDVADSLGNLSILLWYQDELAEARRVGERALAIRSKVFGPDHPEVAATIDTLGIISMQEEDLTAARAYLERALALREKTLGPEHPEIAMSLNNLGSVLAAQGALAEAEAAFSRGLTIKQQALGADHPSIALSLDNLGEVAFLAKKYSESRAFYERALVMREQHDSGNPVDLGDTRFALARTIWASKRDRDRARVLAGQARAAYQRAGTAATKQLARVDAWLRSPGGE